MSYSPNGNKLAIGNHDGIIYVYETKNYTLCKKLTGHTAAILDLDWSKTGSYIRSFSLSYDILYHNAEDGERIERAESLLEVLWETQTCKQGYNVTGIWN